MKERRVESRKGKEGAGNRQAPAIVMISPSVRMSAARVVRAAAWKWENAKFDQVVTQLGTSESRIQSAAVVWTFGPQPMAIVFIIR